jgi:hypothetical protein
LEKIREGNGSQGENSHDPRGDIPSGRRNAELTKIGGRIRNAGIGEDTIAAALKVENRARCKPPLPDEEVEKIAASVATMEAHSRVETRATLSVIPRAELGNFPTPPELIAGFLHEREFVLLYGPPGQGKTFVALSTAFSVVTGVPFLGKPVKATGIAVIVAPEGKEVHHDRLRAMEAYHGIPADGIYVIPEAVLAHEPEYTLQLIGIVRELEATTGRKCHLIVFDTLNENAIGLNENSAAEMGMWLRGIKAVRDATGSTVMVIHHTGKSGDFRGSTAIHGSPDSQIEVTSRTDAYGLPVPQIRSVKQRFGPPYETIYGLAAKVDLGDIEMPVFIANDESANPAITPDRRRSKPMGKGLQTTYDTLARLTSFFPGGVTHGQWKAEATKAGITESSFARHVRELKATGEVEQEDELYRVSVISSVSVSVSAISSANF